MSASFLFFSSRSFTNLLFGPIAGIRVFFSIVRKKLSESALPVPPRYSKEEAGFYLSGVFRIGLLDRCDHLIKNLLIVSHSRCIS